MDRTAGCRHAIKGIAAALATGRVRATPSTPPAPAALVRPVAGAMLAALAASAPVSAQEEPGGPGPEETAGTAESVPEPAEYIGWEPGADYRLSAYEDMTDYYHALADASDRVEVRRIGESVEGRPLYLMVISSPENLDNLEEYRKIAERLALAEGLSDEEGRELAQRGKPFVWLNMGIDPEEVAGPQTGMELAHKLASEDGGEVGRVLEEAVTLLMPQMGPDGHERVREWYTGNLDTEFETAPRPQPYKRHPYMGSDTNRDFMFMHLPKTRAVAEGFWHEWHPQVIHDFHQTGPYPGRIFLPPFADPVNPNVPSQIVNEINDLGTRISNRFAREGKPGAYSHVNYTLWWTGGLRLSPYYRNQLGILSETQLGADNSDYVATPHYTDPDDLPETFTRGIDLPGDRPTVFYPDPWPGGWWHLRDAVDYQMTAAMGTLTAAIDEAEERLYQRYALGRQAIEKGQEDPYAYIVSPEQWDRSAAVDMVDVLRRGGLQVHRATSSFEAGGATRPAGSYVLYAGQAFRPYLKDMMEPQNYPDRREYPGGPPAHPYDLAGWTLPYQMGVQVDRVDEPFEADTEVVEEVGVPEGVIVGDTNGPPAYGWVIPGSENASWKAVNRLREEGAYLERLQEPAEAAGRRFEPGSFVLEATDDAPDRPHRVRELAQEMGVEIAALQEAPGAAMQPMAEARVGVYKSLVKHNDEGWTRFLLERFGFAYESLGHEQVRDGTLDEYDVVVFPAQYRDALIEGHDEGEVPPEYEGGLGSEGVQALRDWVRAGGRAVMLSGASTFALEEFDLPVENAVAGLPEEEFFVPSTLMRLDVHQDHPLGYGMPGETSMKVASTSQYETMAFDGTDNPEVQVIATFPEENLLLSGWELGADEHLGGRPAAVQVEYGQGDLVLFGFPPQFRAGTAATFKLLFNALAPGN